MLLNGISKAERQVTVDVSPALDETVCKVLGGPILWSKNDTPETVNQIEILHNSQWTGFKCRETK